MSDDLKGIIESEVEISASIEQFFNVMKNSCHHMPNIACDHIQAVDIDGFDWDTHGHGSIHTWYYTVDGIAETFKTRIELHEDNKMVCFVGIEGDVFKEYKSIIVVYEPVRKSDNKGCVVKLRVEYEKLDANVPTPTKYLSIISYIAKSVASHIEKN